MDFDPIAQHFWNVANGFTPRLPDYDIRENEKSNLNLIEAINKFTRSLEDLVSSNTGVNQVSSVLEDFHSNFSGCQSFTLESSSALCSLLDTLIKYEAEIEDAWNEDGTEQYEVLANYIDIFANPNCPRPVLWHLVQKVATSNMRWVCDDQKTPFLLYGLGRNPVIGDKCFLEHLKKYEINPGCHDLVATSTAYDAFKNPSLTIETLEKLYCDYWYDFSPEWVELQISIGSYTHALNIAERTSIGASGQGGETSPNGRVFALIVARTFDELKLERLDWERISQSSSVYFRTIAFYWPKTPVATKSKLLQAGIIELNETAEAFLTYSFANPHISALSQELARRPLP
jgi:hypothetical protein